MANWGGTQETPTRTPAPKGAEALGDPNSAGLVRCATANMLLDPRAAQTYVYPGQLMRREYQFQITHDALFTNSLVCLPTGLGKTLIAAVVMYNYYRWFPSGKVVFLAPTRPLVDQQKAACRDICGMPTEETCTLMGSTKKDVDGTRRSLWREKRVFFCTPQTMDNDIRDGVCPANEVVCLVIDEAHRAKGKHAYTQVVQQLWERDVKFRLLALTATPGHNVNEVQQVVRALTIGRIDFRSDQDADVRKHTHKRDIKLETVPSTKAIDLVQGLLRDSLKPILKRALAIKQVPMGLTVARFLDGTSHQIPAAYTIQSIRKEMHEAGGMNNHLHWLMCQAHHIASVNKSLMENTPQVAVDYAAGVADRPQVQALMRENTTYIEAMEMLRSMAGKGAHHSPKLARLTQILRRHFATSDAGSRVIVFTSFRDSVHDIVRALREVTLAKGPLEPDAPQVDPGKGQGTITGMFHAANGGGGGGGGGGVSSKGGGFEEDGGVGYLPGVGEADDGTGCRIKVAEFIGQGDTSRGGRGGAGAARGGKGQSQKEQKAVLDAFRAGALNTIVATSIGEEGLDIPAVDLIVFFDVVDIIRTIQRMGRTGRARDGKVVVLATEGKEADKFSREQGNYNHMLKCLSNPERVFQTCNDCPRMLPPGLHPQCELEELGPTPDQLRVKRATEQTSSGKPRQPRGAAAAAAGSFPVRPWDAPLTAVETSLLSAYDHEPGALHSVDYRSTAPLQRRPTAVYGVPHGRWTGLLTRFVSAARGLPPPARPEGELIRGGPLARARDAEEEAALARRLAEEENAEREEADARAGTPDEAYYAPPMEWDGDAWEPRDAEEKDDDGAPRRDAVGDEDHDYDAYDDDPMPWRDEDDDEWAGGAVEGRFAEWSQEGAKEGTDREDGEANAATNVAEDSDANVDANADAVDPWRTRTPTGATQRLDFSTQPSPRFQPSRQTSATATATTASTTPADAEPCASPGCAVLGCSNPSHASVAWNAASVGVREPPRAPLAELAPTTERVGAGDAFGQTKPASPSAAESARRRLLARQSQSLSQPRSQPRPRDDGDDVDDETLGDVAFHIKQRRLAAAAKRRSASADRRDEPRGESSGAAEETALDPSAERRSSMDVRLSAERRRSAAAKATGWVPEKRRAGVVDDAAAADAAAMPPPPPREATPARATPSHGGDGWGGATPTAGTVGAARRGGDGWGGATPSHGGDGWGGATPSDGGDGWGGATQSHGGDGWGGATPSGGSDGGWGGTQDDDDAGGWGATQATQNADGGGGWGCDQGEDEDADARGAWGWGWGAASQPSQPSRSSRSSQPSRPSQPSPSGGGWGITPSPRAGAGWGECPPLRGGDDAWGRPPPARPPSASRPPSVGGVRATPESEDLMIVKRRKRRAEDALAADGAASDVDDDEQPSLNPRARPKPNLAPDPSPVAARAVAAAHGRKAIAAARRDARVAAARAAARRFVDDEADDDDDDVGDVDGDDWNTDDEAFIAGTQTTDVGCDADDAAMHRRVEMERGSGGDYMAAFGPRVRRRVSDTPSPERRAGDTPPTSQYGGSFIDDGDGEEDEEATRNGHGEEDSSPGW